MKKNIGLFADLKNFNTTLPQTKHLNYIMSTNPVGYANGGDVRAGVPSSNMNVTKGFLPMALGFENGGDAGVQYGLYDKLIMVLQSYLGNSVPFNQIEEKAKELIEQDPAQAEEIIKKDAIEKSVGTGQSNIADTNSRIPPDAQGGRTPTDTAKGENNVFGKILDTTENFLGDAIDFSKETYENYGPGGRVYTPKNAPGGEGITSLDTDSNNIDLSEIINNIDLSKIPKNIVDIYDEYGPGYKKREEENAKVGKEDVIVPETKDDDGGTATKRPTFPATEGSLVGSNEKLTITGDTFKDAANTDNITDKDSKDINDAIKTVTGKEKEKDVPKWAIPLMSAGFGMMASKSPYFLQALGEGGQEGIKSLVAQNTAEQDKLDRISDREYKKIMGEYYKAGGSGSSKTFEQNGVLGQVKDGVFVPLLDTAGNEIKQTITREQALAELSKNDIFNQLPFEEQLQEIENYLMLANNTRPTNQNTTIAEKKDKGFFGKRIDELRKQIETTS